MSSEQENKALVGGWFEGFWGNPRNPQIIDELAAPDMLLQYSLHAPRRGREDVRTNNGTPSVFSAICATSAAGSVLPPAAWVAIVSTGPRPRCPSMIGVRCERIPQGERNSGRHVATISIGTVGIWSSNSSATSSEDGSIHCTSSQTVSDRRTYTPS